MDHNLTRLYITRLNNNDILLRQVFHQSLWKRFAAIVLSADRHSLSLTTFWCHVHVMKLRVARVIEWLISRYISVGDRPSSVVVSETFRQSPRPAVSRYAASMTPWAGPRAPSALSLRGSGRQVLRGPASTEEEPEKFLPSPGCPVADEGRTTEISISGCVPPTVAARGGKVMALILARNRVSIPSRYYTDWGVASQN